MTNLSESQQCSLLVIQLPRPESISGQQCMLPHQYLAQISGSGHSRDYYANGGRNKEPLPLGHAAKEFKCSET